MSLSQLQLRGDRRLVVVALGLLLVPSLWYVRTDLALYETDSPEFLARLVVRTGLLLVCTSGLVAMRAVQTRVTYSLAIVATSWGIVVSLLAMNALRPIGAGLPLRSPLFTIALLYAALPNTFVRQVAPPLVFTACLMWLRVTRLTSGVEADVAGDVVILLSLNAVGVLLVRQRLSLERDVGEAWQSEEVARRDAERALNDLGALRGIIPICSHCRQVRTEVGDWQEIERYVSEQGGADFSHGICPACFERHYPSDDDAGWKTDG